MPHDPEHDAPGHPNANLHEAPLSPVILPVTVLAHAVIGSAEKGTPRFVPAFERVKILSAGLAVAQKDVRAEIAEAEAHLAALRAAAGLAPDVAPPEPAKPARKPREAREPAVPSEFAKEQIARVLEAVTAGGSPKTEDEIAKSTGIQKKVVKAHLEALMVAGDVLRVKAGHGWRYGITAADPALLARVEEAEKEKDPIAEGEGLDALDEPT